MDTKVMQVIQNCKVKTAAEGSFIPGALIYVGTVLVIEQSDESPHDGYVHVVGPNPPINPDGTYLKTRNEGWVELAHLKDANTQSDTVVISIDWENRTWSARAG